MNSRRMPSFTRTPIPRMQVSTQLPVALPDRKGWCADRGENEFPGKLRKFPRVSDTQEEDTKVGGHKEGGARQGASGV